jgi:hypothetical protein
MRETDSKGQVTVEICLINEKREIVAQTRNVSAISSEHAVPEGQQSQFLDNRVYLPATSVFFPD